mmetsp:Transcript_40115/g.120973  ORF Transcript_40115/g.120973 Transcript_40115/m.120973 type:complete len:130 (-) Transcript_40115:157-546(-)
MSNFSDGVSLRTSLLTVGVVVAAFLICLAILRYCCVFCIDQCLLSEGTESIPFLSFFRVWLRSFRGNVTGQGGNATESIDDFRRNDSAQPDESLATPTGLPSCFLRLTPEERHEVIDTILPCKASSLPV